VVICFTMRFFSRSNDMSAVLDFIPGTAPTGFHFGADVQEFGMHDLPYRRDARSVSLTTAQIVSWAEEHYHRTGVWPQHTSGDIPSASGETWATIQYALQRGRRGLPGGDSLIRLLRRAGRLGERRGRPPQPLRYQQAAQLRAEGLSLAEIGRRLAVSRQAAWQLLKKVGRNHDG
jgi:hypothetical protein